MTRAVPSTPLRASGPRCTPRCALQSPDHLVAIPFTLETTTFTLGVNGAQALKFPGVATGDHTAFAVITCLDAGVIYDQPVPNQTDRGPFSELGGQEIADQFVVSSAATVTGVRWSGSQFDCDLNPSVTSLNFVIRFFADASGLPSVTLFHGANVSATVGDCGVVFRKSIVIP